MEGSWGNFGLETGEVWDLLGGCPGCLGSQRNAEGPGLESSMIPYCSPSSPSSPHFHSGSLLSPPSPSIHIQPSRDLSPIAAGVTPHRTTPGGSGGRMVSNS
jgi:hypothetical protein